MTPLVFSLVNSVLSVPLKVFQGPLYFSQKMHFHFYHLLVVAVLAIVVQSNSTPGIREKDMEPAETLGRMLDNSINFSVMFEAVMPRIEEWLVQIPFQFTFSAITNSSSVFSKLAEYVVESVRGRHYNASLIYSSNENETTIEFERSCGDTAVKLKPRLWIWRLFRGRKAKRYHGIEVKLTLLYRTSERGFLAIEFRRHCHGKGSTITLVRAENGRMAAAYNGGSWGVSRSRNPRGFLASIVEDPGAIGGYFLDKYAANDHASVHPFGIGGPWFGHGLCISNKCNENEISYSYLGPRYGYGEEGVDPTILFGEENFRVLEYEVFQVEIQDIV
jgi:hypothetical protein